MAYKQLSLFHVWYFVIFLGKPLSHTKIGLHFFSLSQRKKIGPYLSGTHTIHHRKADANNVKEYSSSAIFLQPTIYESFTYIRNIIFFNITNGLVITSIKRDIPQKIHRSNTKNVILNFNLLFDWSVILSRFFTLWLLESFESLCMIVYATWHSAKFQSQFIPLLCINLVSKQSFLLIYSIK